MNWLAFLQPLIKPILNLLKPVLAWVAGWFAAKKEQQYDYEKSINEILQEDNANIKHQAAIDAAPDAPVDDVLERMRREDGSGL